MLHGTSFVLKKLSHFMFLQSIFAPEQLIVVAVVTDVSMVLSAIWLPGPSSEIPGLWLRLRASESQHQTQGGNKKMPNVEQLKSRGKRQFQIL